MGRGSRAKKVAKSRLGQGGALNLNQALAGIEADQLELRAV